MSALASSERTFDEWAVSYVAALPMSAGFHGSIEGMQLSARTHEDWLIFLHLLLLDLPADHPSVIIATEGARLTLNGERDTGTTPLKRDPVPERFREIRSKVAWPYRRW